MDLTAIRSRVRDLTGFYLAEYMPDSRIDAVVNEGYAQLCGSEDWTWLRSFVTVAGADGVSEYVIEPMGGVSSIRQVLAVAGSSVTELQRTPALSAGLVSQPDVPPSAFAVSRLPSAFIVWPATQLTGVTLRVAFKMAARTLTSGSDVPDFPAEYRPALAYAAAARLLVQENDDTPRAQAYAQEYASIVERMRIDDRSVGSKSFVMGSEPRSRRRRYLSWGY